jgi:uncharacterized integral membrane protein
LGRILTFLGESVSFRTRKRENSTMSSDPSESPDNLQLSSKTSPVDASNPKPPDSAVRFTRTASVWTSLTAGFLILAVLLVFITQNTESGQFAFLGWRWTLPLGVAMLLAAVCGGLITILAGTARMYQLRRAAKKNLVGGR